jgi:hypothetical protein
MCSCFRAAEIAPAWRRTRSGALVRFLGSIYCRDLVTIERSAPSFSEARRFETSAALDRAANGAT